MTTFILIHGAWQASWCWREVTPRLERMNHRVLAIDLPGHGKDSRRREDVQLQDYVDAVIESVREVEIEGGAPILVGHSMTGILGQTAEQIPDRIRALVYVAGHVTPNGATMMQAVSRLDPQYLGNIIWAPDRLTAQISPEGASQFLYSMCAASVVDSSLPLLTSEPVSPFDTPIVTSPEKFGRVKKHYIETLRDRVLPVEVQRSMHSAIPFEQIYTIDTDHSPFFSTPEKLASILDSIANY